MRIKSGMAAAAFIALLAASSPASAEPMKARKEQVRTACNNAGGELLGISEFGRYGCDNTKNGSGMILCNKKSECTPYTSSRKRSDVRRMKDFLRLGGVAVKQ